MAKPSIAGLPKEVVLAGQPDGSFRLEGGQTWRLCGGVVDGGLEIELPDGGGTWRLERIRESPAGVILKIGSGADAEELGRTARWSDEETEGSAPATVLLNDGRLFTVVVRGPSDPRCELAGWESPGAYFAARLEGDRWRITRNPAGRDLVGGTEILVLFAMELLRILDES